MEIEEIIRLVERVSASGLSEFVYSEGDTKLVLKAPAPVSAAAPVVTLTEECTGLPDNLQKAPDDQDKIKSPLVGTFYRAPSEDAAPFVAVGDPVKKGQVLGLIETMKLMNEVECDRDGIITEVLIENEQVVEYGQPLFAIG